MPFKEFLLNKAGTLILDSDFIEVLKYFESQSFDTHSKYCRGMKVDHKEGLFSVHRFNGRGYHTEFHDYIGEKGLPKNVRDFLPVFNPKAALGTSVFQSKYDLEYEKRKKKEITENYNKRIEREKMKIPRALKIPEPEPFKEHRVCFICKKENVNYLDHIISKEHKKNY